MSYNRKPQAYTHRLTRLTPELINSLSSNLAESSRARARYDLPSKYIITHPSFKQLEQVCYGKYFNKSRSIAGITGGSMSTRSHSFGSHFNDFSFPRTAKNNSELLTLEKRNISLEQAQSIEKLDPKHTSMHSRSGVDMGSTQDTKGNENIKIIQQISAQAPQTNNAPFIQPEKLKNVTPTLPGYLNALLTHNNKPSSARPFYYSDNNDVLSVDEFFTNFRTALNNRKRAERLASAKVFKEKNLKIQTSTLGTPANMNNSPFPASGMNSARRPGTNLTPSLIKSPIHGIRKPMTATVQTRERKVSIKQVGGEGNKKRLNREELRLALDKLSVAEDQDVADVYKLKSIEHIGATSARSENPLKMTQKEVDKQILKSMVSPGRLKKAEGAHKKEENLMRMFRDPKVMDYQVAGSIRKAERTLKEGLVGESIVEKMIRENKGGVEDVEKKKSRILELRNDDNRTVKERADEVAKKIKDRIENIERVLTAGDREEKEKDVERKENRVIKTGNKVVLRSQFKKKHDFGEYYSNHREVHEAIKEKQKEILKRPMSMGGRMMRALSPELNVEFNVK